MKLLSLNVGLPREVQWHGRAVTTGIFKRPVEGRVALRTYDCVNWDLASSSDSWG